MTDPTDGLVSFQQALLNGEIDLQRGELDREVFVHFDQPTASTNRFTYVKLDRKTVKALAMIVPTQFMHGLPCFQMGVAVPEDYRGKGYAKNIMEAAIAEFKNGLARNNIPSFYIEAVVSVENAPSKRIAETVICATPTAITDSESGLPALHYVRKV